MAGPGIRNRRTLLGILYTVFTLAVYVVGLWLLFPYPELARNVEDRLRSEGVEVAIQNLGPGTFPGIAARRVTFRPAPESEWKFELADARLRLPPTRLVRGDRALELTARVLGGTLEALARRGPRDRIEATWEDLDLSRLSLPHDLQELTLLGQISGSLDAEVDPAAPAQVSGTLRASISRLKIGPGKAKGVPVPEIALGEGKILATSQEGKVEVETAQLTGGDLGVEFKGNLLLREDPARSPVNGLLSLLPNEKASKDLALLFAVFPGAKGSDGRFTARLSGSLAAPRLRRR